jgi:hypothetical protein
MENQQTTSTAPFQNRIDLTRLNSAVEAIKKEIRKIIIGKDHFLWIW